MEPLTVGAEAQRAVRRMADPPGLAPAVPPQDRRNALMLQTVLAITVAAAGSMTVHSLLGGRDAASSETWGPGGKAV